MDIIKIITTILAVVTVGFTIYKYLKSEKEKREEFNNAQTVFKNMITEGQTKLATLVQEGQQVMEERIENLYDTVESIRMYNEQQTVQKKHELFVARLPAVFLNHLNRITKETSPDLQRRLRQALMRVTPLLIPILEFNFLDYNAELLNTQIVDIAKETKLLLLNDNERGHPELEQLQTKLKQHFVTLSIRLAELPTENSNKTIGARFRDTILKFIENVVLDTTLHFSPDNTKNIRR